MFTSSVHRSLLASALLVSVSTSIGCTIDETRILLPGPGAFPSQALGPIQTCAARVDWVETVYLVGNSVRVVASNKGPIYVYFEPNGNAMSMNITIYGERTEAQRKAIVERLEPKGRALWECAEKKIVRGN